LHFVFPLIADRHFADGELTLRAAELWSTLLLRLS
ncbi:hypothetical protein ACLKA7_007659, partial [Drosophila subpalustris]